MAIGEHYDNEKRVRAPNQKVESYLVEPTSLNAKQIGEFVRILEYNYDIATDGKKPSQDGRRARRTSLWSQESIYSALCEMKYILDAVTPTLGPEDLKSVQKFQKYVSAQFAQDDGLNAFYTRQMRRDADLREKRELGIEGAEEVTDGFGAPLVNILEQVLLAGDAPKREEREISVLYDGKELYRTKLEDVKLDSGEPVFSDAPKGSTIYFNFTHQALELDVAATRKESAKHLGAEELRNLEKLVITQERGDKATKKALTDLYLGLQSALDSQLGEDDGDAE